MELANFKHIGQAVPGKINEWKNDPSDIHAAIGAAANYAKKQNTRFIVIQGNSYMRKVYHVARENADVMFFTAMRMKCRVIVVEPSLETYYADAE